ncbi:MAG: hypothetical protein IPM81_16635 [Saprospirales bacterium]|nr:hypothetical protein [Saprospirales bacterium]
MLKRESRLLELERDMFDQYLDLLELSGPLSAAPSVNYLSAARNAF